MGEEVTHTYDNVLGATWSAGSDAPLWKRYTHRGRHHKVAGFRKVYMTAFLIAGLLWTPIK